MPPDSPPPGAVICDESVAQRLAQLASQTTEELYRELVDALPQPVAVHAEGRLVYVNRAALSLLGASSPQAVLGRPIFDFLHPDYHGIASERILKMEQVGDPAEPLVQTLLRVDGTPIDVELAAAPVPWWGRSAIQLAGEPLGDASPRSVARRRPVVDFSALLLDLTSHIERRIAPRATLTLDLCAARVALCVAPGQLEDLVCLLVRQVCAALPGGRGALVLKSERQDLGAEALAAFVPGSRTPGPYLLFEAGAPDGELERAASRRLFDRDFAERHRGQGPGLAGALAAVRGQGGALRVRSGAGRGLRIALALPASGARCKRPGAKRARRRR